MLQRDTLIKRFAAMKLDCYETVSDVPEDTSIQLQNLDELCAFIDRHDIDTVFFHFDYASENELQITSDIFRELNIDEEILSVMEPIFNKYNNRVTQLDFSRPYALTVYCIYQSFLVYCDEYDYWFREMGYDMPKMAAITMIEEKLEAIEKKKEKAAKKREEQRDLLRQRILLDENFHKCTNKELRRAYIQKLWNSDKTIQALFYSPKCGLYDIRIDTFIDEVWKTYKAGL